MSSHHQHSSSVSSFSASSNRHSNTNAHQQSNSNSSYSQKSTTAANAKQFSGPSSSAQANAQHSSSIRHSSQGSQSQLPHPSQILSGYSTQPHQSGNTQSTSGGTPVGGSGGSTTGVSKIVVAQVFLLLSTIKEDKWESTAKQIHDLIDNSPADVHVKVLHRLIQLNSNTIFSSAMSRQPDNQALYLLLRQFVKDYANHPQDAKSKFADAVNSYDKDFDLITFLNHCDLDALEKSIIALSFKTSPKQDLRSKAHDVISLSFQPMLEILSNPSSHSDMNPDTLAYFLQQYYTEPLPTFFDTNARLMLSSAVRSRYPEGIPGEIRGVTDPIEALRQQERLSSVFLNVGPNATASVDNCRQVLRSQWRNQIREQDVADVLIVIATSPNPAEWNGQVFVQTVQSEGLHDNFDWTLVAKHLDHPEFVLKDTEGLALVLDAFFAIDKLPDDFAITDIWAGRWANVRSQLSVLKAYNSLRVDSDRFDITKVSRHRKVLTQEDFQDAPTSIKALAISLESQKLNSVATVDAVLHLAFDPDLPQEIMLEGRALLERAAKFTPELLILGAFQLPRPWTQEHEQTVYNLFSLFFQGHPSFQLVFWKLWKQDKIYVARIFLEKYSSQPGLISRIFEIADGLHAVEEMLDVGNAQFVLDFAAYAAEKDAIDLAKWLREMISKHGTNFIMECLRFLKQKADEELVRDKQAPPLPTAPMKMTVGPVYTFLQVLDKCDEQTGIDTAVILQIQRACIAAFPRLVNMGQGKDHIILANAANAASQLTGFPKDVDEEMQGNYKRLYSQDVDIRGVVDYLGTLKASDVPRDQELFACMVHGLFDEYQCFPDYPLPALATTAVLFGSLVSFGLVDGIPLRVALSMVLEAVTAHPQDSPMFKFGLQALMNFPARLHEWKRFCASLIAIPALQGTEIYQIASQVVQEQEERLLPNGGLGNGTMENGTVEPQAPPVHPFHSLHVDPPAPVNTSYHDPEEDNQDKILFIINNIAETNFEQKLTELKTVLKDEYFQWFADYLVEQRAKMEPNYHKLYLDLLDKYGSKALFAEILRGTYVNVIRMLNSESTVHSSVERSHLKNLASWLGGLTIARDKPIKHKNISFKDLLIEGYESGRLIVVLPFTCKVLEQATKSTVFKPPNPWLMHVMKILAELYQFAELKLQLKFEIEVLCKNLELDIKEIEPATVIRERPPTAGEDNNIQGLVDELGELAVGETAGGFSPQLQITLPEIASQIVYPQAVTAFAQHPPLKRILSQAIDEAIREIITPVVERSVTIATISTGQLIVKDFAMEGNEDKMLAAAHNMVQTLAGNLALVTCKEPLRLSMSTHLRQQLAHNGISEQHFGGDPAIAACVNENLDLACHVVEKAAQERSLPEVDESLGSASEARKRHRELRPGQHFVDPSMSRFAFHLLPEPFRLKAGGLTPQQIALYEQFHRMPRPTELGPDHARAGNEMLQDYGQIPQAISDAANGPQNRAASAIAAMNHTPQPQPQPTPMADTKLTLENKILEQLTALRKLTVKFGDRTLDEVAKEDDGVGRTMQEIIDTASIPIAHDQLSLRAAQFICNLLYTELEKNLEIEAFVVLLDRICKRSAATAKEVVNWLITHEDDRKFNVPVTIMLIKTQLLSIPHLDTTLAKSIQSRKPLSVEFLTNIMRKMVLSDRPMAYRTDFVTSMEAAAAWLKEDENQTAVQELYNELGKNEPTVDLDNIDDLREQMEYVFQEWLQLYGHIQAQDKHFVAFVYQLSQQKLLHNTESLAVLLRTCLERSFADYLAVNANDARRGLPSSSNQCFLSVDAFAKLVMTLFWTQAEKESEDGAEKVAFLRSMLSVILLCFNHQCQQYSEDIASGKAMAAQFPQRFYFRLFASLLCEYNKIMKDTEELAEPVFKAFSDTFVALRPANFPFFTLGWITLISHRMYAPVLLKMGKVRGWPVYFNILEVMVNDLMAQMKEMEFAVLGKHVYRGILRIFLVLLHDFSDFLNEHYFALCDVIPAAFVQLRNLVLTAVPSTLPDDLPNPFLAGLNLDRIPETRIAPTIASDYTAMLKKHGLQELVEACLSPSNPNAEVIKDIISLTESLQIKETDIGFSRITPGVQVLHALALTIGVDAISKAAARGVHIFQPQSPHTGLMMRLVVELKPQSRYHFLNGIANNLRYANSHTQYFSALLLFMFSSVQGSPNELDIRQQISRVLVERLVVQKPHPWGLIFTLLELLRNPVYNFWQLNFIKAAPEVETLFAGVISQINEP